MCKITQPKIRYYAKMVLNTSKGKKTPKYTIQNAIGYYPPMSELIGKDGQVSFYLMEKLKEGQNVPSMRLQAKGGLNFTGLKDYFVDGKLSGYAYGYPHDKPTYSKKNTPNPFFDYKGDGFLFTCKSEEGTTEPTEIELLVLADAKVLISAYCKQLTMGGFNEELERLRNQCL